MRGLLVLLISWACLGSVARADTDTDARSAFEAGVAAARAQDWETARRSFERSRQLVVKPSTLFNLALVEVKLDHGDAAMALLDEFERLADPTEHAAMLARVQGLRAQAESQQESQRPATERVRALIEPDRLPEPARAQFERGREAFLQGDDRVALSSFSAAYETSQRPELLYDVGVVADRLREDDGAIHAFRRFVAAMPGAPEAALAQKRIERLELMRSAPSTPSPEVTSPAARSREPSPALLLGPRLLVGMGGVLAGAALGTAFWWADRSDAEGQCARRTCEAGNVDAIATELRAAKAVTLTLGITAVAMVTTGAVMLGRRKQAARVDVSMGARHVWVGARWSF